MTKRDVLSVAFKVMGVVFLADAVATIPGIIQSVEWAWSERMTTAYNPLGMALLQIGSVVLNLFIAAVLIGSADAIARALVKEDGEVSLPSLAGQEPLVFALAARVVGLVLVARAIPGLLRVFAQGALYSKLLTGSATGGLAEAFGASGGRIWVDQWAGIVQSGTILIIGVYCLIWPDGLAKRLYRRTADPGREQAEV